MRPNLLEIPRIDERPEASVDWRSDDPAIAVLATTSLGSYGWRWLLFLSGQNSGVLEPREPFWDG